MENQTIELSQKVRIDLNFEKLIEQFVTYDPSDKWICLTNDGNEISLSLENYYKLTELAEKVINNL